MNKFELLKIALDKSNSVIYEWDIDGDKIKWFGNVTRLLSTFNLAAINSKESFLEMIHDEDKISFLESYQSIIDDFKGRDRKYRILKKDDTISLHEKCEISNIDGKKYLVGVITIDEGEKQNAEQVNYDIDTDQHYDVDKFLSKLTAINKTCAANGKEGILLRISIDNLPMVMTWYSQNFADRVMESLEFQLQDLIRDDDIIMRIAIDQFGVILRNQSQGEVDLVIDRILRKIQLYNNPSFDEPIHLRTSIGSVHFPTDIEDAQDAFRKSYLALSNAKSKAAKFHSDYLDAKREHLNSKDQVTKLLFVQQAFREKNIRLAYQPVIESATGKVISYESLLRVIDTDKSQHLQSAGPLIPVAEKMGFIDTIDDYLLERTVDELSEYKDIVIGFNVSNLTTSNPAWLQKCTRMMNKYGVSERVIIEITETAAQGDMRQTAYFVAALQSIGCKVALDDFGAGYTSFRQLKSLSVDKVKIDGSYIKGLEENSGNMLFIKTLLDFSHSYGLETVAEQVETGEVAKILMDIGVDSMQGYYFGKPSIKRPWSGERRPYELQTSD